MNTRNLLTRIACAAFILLVALQTSVLAEEGIEPQVSGSSVIWNIAPEYAGQNIALTVAGPNGFLEETLIPAGGPVDFQTSRHDTILSDGQYKWEIVLVPTLDGKIRGDAASGEGTDSQSPIFSGAFLVAGGQPVYANIADNPAVLRDQVIADDLIAQSSLCVGYDCVNGESFGFDTLRLKENNTRIAFSDTSTTAGFPANDWEITANDSSTGGNNYLGIKDTTSGRMVATFEKAPANSLYLDDSGRLGLGTSTPVLELHIADGDTPSVRLDQDGSSGWSPQVWDVAGNESNFFIRDVTNGSKLPFRIKPGAATNSIYIDSGGKVTIGATTGAEKFNVEGNAFISGNIEIGSSRTLKQDIEPLSATEALAAVKALEPVRFAYKSDPEETTLGFIAEDVPALVATNERKSVNPMDVIAALTRTVQEQQSMIETQAKAFEELVRQFEDFKKDVVTRAADSRPLASAAPSTL